MHPTIGRTAMMRALAGALLIALGAAGCDNPVKPGGHEEEAHGLAILAGETELARYFEGEVTGRLPDVIAGEQSEELTLVFLDHDGEPLDLSGEEELTVRARTSNTAVATFAVTGYTGRVQGVGAGSAQIFFDLIHGDPETGGHPDFSSAGFPVTVVAP